MRECSPISKRGPAYPGPENAPYQTSAKLEVHFPKLPESSHSHAFISRHPHIRPASLAPSPCHVVTLSPSQPSPPRLRNEANNLAKSPGFSSISAARCPKNKPIQTHPSPSHSRHRACALIPKARNQRPMNQRRLSRLGWVVDWSSPPRPFSIAWLGLVEDF
jgi:hypothetical protein